MPTGTGRYASFSRSKEAAEKTVILFPLFKLSSLGLKHAFRLSKTLPACPDMDTEVGLRKFLA
jgi:hypothetical protein